MTSPRRAERRSISSLISFSVRMSIKTSGREGIFLRIPELVEAVLVDPEVVGQLVEDRDPDLLFELLGVREGLRQRLAEDRDLVRHVLGRLPESEQVGVVRILGLHHDGDVLEGAGEPGRQLVERSPNVLLERHSASNITASNITASNVTVARVAAGAAAAPGTASPLGRRTGSRRRGQ